MNKPRDWLAANWPAPDWVRAGTSLRTGAAGNAGTATELDLGIHSDGENQLQDNRRHLQQLLQLPSTPVWLNQLHGRRIIDLDKNPPDLNADGAVTTKSGTVCAVLTADCVPVLFLDAGRHRIAAVHVGWRGFSKQIINSAIQMFADGGPELMVWIGPHICGQHYEIDDEVRRACLNADSSVESAFVSARKGHWFADLGKMIRITLKNAGINNVYHTGECTYGNAERYYSYRRDGDTGRMATLIWMDRNHPGS